MEKSKTQAQGAKVPKGTVLVLELYGPGNNSSKLNTPIFSKPIPSEWKSKWLRNIEFLFVTTGTCAGLGNIWRFPNIALKYGGGTFLIVYLFALIILGIPIFYLEVVLGQFVSRAGTRIFDCVPVMRGIGYGQMLISTVVATYYSGVSTQAGKYLISSFRSTLPWTAENRSFADAEAYYRNSMMPEIETSTTVESMLLPNYELLLYSLLFWIAVANIVNKGQRALSWFGCILLLIVIFIMMVVLAQVLVLPGAIQGAHHFFVPSLKDLTNGEVWFEAVVQVLFSLSICFGPITMYASFNRFSYNMFTDMLMTVLVNIVMILLSGCTYFSFVGNLVHLSNLNYADIADRGGYNVLLIYAHVIGKFKFLPQVSSVLFFSTFFMIGIASSATFTFFVVQAIRDEYFLKNVRKTTVTVVALLFALSYVYLAPIGEYCLNLLDVYGIPSAIIFTTIVELMTFAWMYGVKRVCDDIEFMFGFRTSYCWQTLWYILPVTIIAVFVFHLVFAGMPLNIFKADKLTIASGGYILGLSFILIIILIIVGWSIYVVLKQPKIPDTSKMKLAFSPVPNWSPADASLHFNYRHFLIKKAYDKT